LTSLSGRVREDWAFYKEKLIGEIDWRERRNRISPLCRAMEDPPHPDLLPQGEGMAWGRCGFAVTHSRCSADGFSGRLASGVMDFADYFADFFTSSTADVTVTASVSPTPFTVNLLQFNVAEPITAAEVGSKGNSPETLPLPVVPTF
jgi:hypothetical protein